MTTDKHKITPEMQADLDAVEAALAGTAPEAGLTDLGRLALELRAERPEPDPFFTRELDAKAAAGFPRTRPDGVGWWRRIPQTALASAAACVLIVTAVSVSVLGGDDSPVDVLDAGPPLTASQPESDTAATAEESGGGGSMPGGSSAAKVQAQKRSSAAPTQSVSDESAGLAAPTPPPPTGGGSGGSDARTRRVQETSASLTLTAPPDRIATVSRGVRDVTTALGGFVVSSSVSTTDGDGGGGIFEIRVPSAKLQRALDELGKLAHVAQSQTASQDITAESVSAKDRLQDARAERVALLRRLANADTQAEIDSVKARLRLVSARIAAAKADVSRVNNRASFSNIAVSLAADPDAGDPGTDDGQWSPGDAARDALRVLEVIAGIALVALAVGIPVALLVTLLLAAARLAGRRRRERVLDAV